MDVFPEFNIEDFKVIKKIGEGTFGEIFLIENKEDHKLYAAKEMKSADESFSKEIKSYSKVNNQAILTTYGYYFKNTDEINQPVIISDYMPNGSLQEMLQKERVSLARHDFTSTKKFIILIGVALGMKYLHFKGIVHRDLKPGNILLDKDLNPKICDFGCSAISKEDITDLYLSSEEGTPMFMAPEIFGDDYFSLKIDVYAFSMLAYEVITGRPPFVGYKTPIQLIEDVINGKRPDTNEMNEIIRVFLEKCWSKNSEERPTFGQIYSEMMHAEFKEAFGVLDDEEIEDYLDLFDDDIKDPILMDFTTIKKMKNKIEHVTFNIKEEKESRFLFGDELMNLCRKMQNSDSPRSKFLWASTMNRRGNEEEKKKNL